MLIVSALRTSNGQRWFEMFVAIVINYESRQVNYEGAKILFVDALVITRFGFTFAADQECIVSILAQATDDANHFVPVWIVRQVTP